MPGSVMTKIPINPTTTASHLYIPTFSLNKNIDKTEFTKEMQLLFSTLYLHYGNENLLNEITNEMMNADDPETKSDIDEYLNFIECLKSIKYIEEKDVNSDIDYNPNGSCDDIAGILSKNGRVLGMMPHPERAINSLHGGTDGLKFLTKCIENIVG